MSADLVELHDEIDGLVSRLEHELGPRITCHRGCHGCCVDDITVFAVEADRIRSECADVLATETPHPAGACAFLSVDGACRIYAARPYVCRTQGLPLRWIEEEDDAIVERRDICELNEAGPPIVELDAQTCWTIGPAETKLFALQKKRGGSAERVALRELFPAKKVS